MIPVTCTPKFSIGDRVSSVNTGFPMSGTIHGMLSPYLFDKMYNAAMYLLWGELYPDWTDKIVYNVIFDQPQKNMTFKEFKKCNMKHSKIYRDEDQEIQEYNKIPLAAAATYPEDDLTFLENDELYLEEYSESNKMER